MPKVMLAAQGGKICLKKCWMHKGVKYTYSNVGCTRE